LSARAVLSSVHLRQRTRCRSSRRRRRAGGNGGGLEVSLLPVSPELGSCLHVGGAGPQERLTVRLHSNPSTRSTTQHPRKCVRRSRQWSSADCIVQPASSRASARIGRSPKRSSS